MQSLADLLRLSDPATPEAPRRDDRTDVRSLPTNVRQFCRAVVESPEYRAALYERIVERELPPQVEAMIWDRAYGKVTERLEIKDKSYNTREMTTEQIRARLLDIAAHAKDLATPSVTEDPTVH